MNSTPLTPELRATAPALAEGLLHILTGLSALIARAFLRHPRYVTIIVPLWTYLQRTAKRTSRMMARLAAGTPSRPSHPGTSSGRQPTPFPTERAWILAALRHEAAYYTQWLDRLLARPDIAALVAARPQTLRLIRPLAHMLGATHPALARPKRQPRRRVTPPPPAAEAQAKDSASAHPSPPCPHVFWPWRPRPAPRPTLRPPDSPLLRLDPYWDPSNIPA